MVTQAITVPLDGDSPFEKVKMHQSDSARVLNVHIIFGGQPYTIPAGTTGEFRATKPDRTAIMTTSNVRVNSGYVQVTISQNTLAAIGIVFCDLVLFSGEQQLGTARWMIEVMRPGLAWTTVQSSNEWQSLTQAIAEAEGYADLAQIYADAAAQSSGSSHSYMIGAIAAAVRAENAAKAIKNITVRDPVTGLLGPLQVALDSLYGLHREGALTAEEYRALGLTASAYLAFSITAHDYSINGKQILGG